MSTKTKTKTKPSFNKAQIKRRELRRYQTTAARLHGWLRWFVGINVPREPVCAHHNAPFDYLKRVYFEPGRDVIVWAPRGGGKTRLGAVATLLDLLHKPNVQVRILGGSLEQSLKMWDHLRTDLERLVPDQLKRSGMIARRVELLDASQAAVLPQSQKAVRGLRVQKLRCDEVELFEQEVWEAAKFVTRSSTDAKGRAIRGAVEAMSTYHKPWGLMKRVVENANEKKIPVLKWCILDVLEKCPPARECTKCDLWEECKGVAKTRCEGFFSIDDAIAIKRRASVEHWQSEMLCNRPSTQGAVFKTFSREAHVRAHELESSGWRELSWGIDFGFKNPFVCLWIVTTQQGEVHVIDEYVRREQMVHEHLAEIEQRRWGRPRWIGCDPAGSGANDQTAESNVDLLRRRGYRVRTLGSKILDGVELIRAALQPAAGNPVLFIHERCAELIKALESYHYHPTSGGENPEKDGVHDHLIDALRYFFVNRSRGEVVGGRRY
ncbi:MAG: hypothetical protein QOF78_3825 [Phycisphaerales bacterium]|jgi:hypothetical protein|nr:hypothetical protein [Phycisphaerales bacterium]